MAARYDFKDIADLIFEEAYETSVSRTMEAFPDLTRTEICDNGETCLSEEDLVELVDHATSNVRTVIASKTVLPDLESLLTAVRDTLIETTVESRTTVADLVISLAIAKAREQALQDIRRYWPAKDVSLAPTL